MAAGTVLLVTRDSDLKSSLTEALSADAVAIEPTLSGEELLASRRDWQAGGCSIVVDAASLGTNAVSAIADLAARTSPAPVIVLLQDGDVRFTVDLMRAGAYHVIDKCDSAFLVTCIESSLKPDGLAQRRKQAAMRQVVLTASEQEVLRLTVAGLSNKQIAHRLELSLRTVNMRRAKLLEKFGASSRTDLIRLAVEAALCRQEGEAAAP